MGFCINCNAPLMAGKSFCQKCGAWTTSDTASLGGMVGIEQTEMLSDVEAKEMDRIVTGGPWDGAWGGGFVHTAITLLGGSPGAGKSTLMLQLASAFYEKTGKTSWFLSAEQASGEIRITADRLGLKNMNHIRVLRKFGAGAELDEESLKKDPPGMFIVDSISALCGKDTHAAIEIGRRYKQYSVKYNAPSFLICQMTKDGDFAGLLRLQHDVDTVTTLASDVDKDGLRELQSWKNRYGPTNQPYRLSMTQQGLVAAPKEEKGSGRLDFPPGVAEEVEAARVMVRESPGVPLDLRKLLKRLGRVELAIERLQPRRPPLPKPPRAEAVEGEALKRPRAPMQKNRVRAETEKPARSTASSSTKRAKGKDVRP